MQTRTTVLRGSSGNRSENHLLLPDHVGVDNHRDDLSNHASVTLYHSDLSGRLDRCCPTPRSVTLDHHLEGNAEGRAEVAHDGLGWSCPQHPPQP